MAVNFVGIPQEIKNSCRFCTWKFEKRGGKKTKVPYNPATGSRAQADRPESFSGFATAMTAVAMGRYDGIGIRVDEVAAIDIDHCIREDGTLNDVAASILAIFPDIYVERSPSGTGLRAFFRVAPDYVFDKAAYYINNRRLGLEIYVPGATNRFVTVTGNVYRDGAVPDATEQLISALDTYMKRPRQITNSTVEPCSYLTDEQVIAHASKSPTGEKFVDFYRGDWQKYHDNQSDADMAFVAMLAFWCGNVEEQIDRIFRASGMMRDKWDRAQAGSTYGALTIRNVVLTNGAIYLPVHAAGLNDEFSSLDDDGSENEKKPDEDFTPDLSYVTAKLEEMAPHTNPRYQRDEIGIGNIFADYYFPIARFCRDREIWYVFDGHIWREDTAGLKVAELAKVLADRLYTFALQIKDEDTRTRYIKRVQKLQVRKHRDTMLKDARSVHPIPMLAFDRDTDLFNCRNGTLNLSTMEFREHRPEDFLTMMAGVEYDPDVACPRWDAFISEVMCGDEELGGYLKKALGYTLTGDTSLECLFILYGPTSRNGKGTTMETYLKIMGDYGKTSNPEMLAMKFGTSNSSGPSEEIARLAGVRFVNISEPEKKISFNAALVKRMTGNDTLNARFLHQNSFDFKPIFKIFINTNYLPNVADMTLFDSGRLKIIPFRRTFGETEQDTNLKKFFAQPENLSGIFNWVLDGYRLFRKEQLGKPQAVIEATEQYRQDSDRFSQFIDAWIEEGEAYEVRTMAAYRVYTKWCTEYVYHAENFKNFRAAMGKRFNIVMRRPKDGGEKASLIEGCRLLAVERGKEEGNNPALTPAEDEFSKLE